MCPKVPFLVLYFYSIFINDLFLFIETTTLCYYADDNTMYSSDKNSNIVISRLKYDFGIISEWFYENHIMVLNPHKCHFLILGFNKLFPDFYFENTIIKNVTEEKILGIVIDNKRCYKRINKIHERSLRLILNDYESSFDSLLSTLNEKNNSSALHNRFTNRLLPRYNE